MRILMVDDDVVGMGGMLEMLQIEGHNVDFASCQREAWQYLRSADYDVAIIDIMFPYGEVDLQVVVDRSEDAGVALLRRIRSGEFGRNAGTRVIVYTAKTTDPQLPARLVALGVGDDDLFFKPGKALEIVGRLAGQQ